MKQKLKEFKQLYNKEIKPRLKKIDELDSERNKLYSEINKLYSEINKIDLEKNKLYSEINKFYLEKNKIDSKMNKLDSERNKLYSEINKLNSEKNKLYSEILMIFYRFEKKNNCVVEWDNYYFRLDGISLKRYNKDKTGFIFTDMKGKIKEELFKKKKFQNI